MHLTSIASLSLQQPRKVELNNALVEAFSILTYCTLSERCITTFVLPGLKYLETLVDKSGHKDAVQNLIQELEAKTDAPKSERLFKFFFLT